MPSVKYLQSYLDYFIKRSLIGGKNIHQKSQTLISAVLKNKKLAEELENEAKKQHGFLTYAQFLFVIQFGKYGYHNTHKFHGMTDVHLRWGKPLAALCQKYSYNDIVEFGFGDCALALRIIRAASENDIPLTWHGIEISEVLLNQAKKFFEKKNLLNHVGQLATQVNQISIKKPFLAFFPFSLDSIPPLVFTNTENTPGIPNAMIGITIKNGVVTETVLSSKWLHSMGFSLKNGIYTHKDVSFNLTSWRLQKNQFAFIPIHALLTLSKASQVMPKGSRIMIIDEFQNLPISFEVNHLCTPKDLEKFGPNRSSNNLVKLYENSGKDLFYYTPYISSYISTLSSLGFSNISYEDEHTHAEKLMNKKTNYKYTGCFAIFAEKINTTKRKITVKFPLSEES